jgi:pyrrolidone-carboxylate peptidase
VASTSSELLAASGFERFVPTLARALEAAPSTAAARAAGDRIGRDLWSAATAAARAGRGDDRPLYWARVQMTRAIDQWQPRYAVSATERAAVVAAFDRASRGMTTAAFGGPATATAKRIVISGFDPFGQDMGPTGQQRETNPSGAAALALDGRTLTNGGVSARVEAVVFPVTYAAFDAGVVEQVFRPHLTGARPAHMIMTISRGGPGFEVEEFAGRTRGGGIEDNADVAAAGDAAPPGLGTGPQFIRGTLPASARGALGRTAPSSAESEVREIPAGGGAPRHRAAGPSPGSTAVAGSGGNFLSNEIFYRVGLLRLGAGSTVPFGHLHVPTVAADAADLGAQRDRVVREVERVLTATLPDL